jgi:transglutaminase-like putative cysteine protease
MSNPTNTLAPSSQRLPLALSAAALVAFTAMFFTGDRFLALPVLAVFLIATYITHWRFTERAGMRWAIRIIAFGTILTIIGLPREEFASWYMQPSYTKLIGYLLSAELVIRAWQKHLLARRTQHLGVILFLTALIMAAASNTYDRQPMQTLAPLYLLLVVLSLRSLHQTVPTTARSPPARKSLAPLVALRTIALMLAMALGFGVVLLLTHYDNRLTAWAVQFIRQDKPSKASAIGLNGAPRLRQIFNPEQSMERAVLIEGSRTERHLRVMAFDTYENHEWRPAIGIRIFTPADPQRLHTVQTGRRLKITRLSDLADMLPIPSETTAIHTQTPLEVEELSSFRDHESSASPSYEVSVPGPQLLVPLASPPDPAQRARALFIPPAIDPKIADLTRQIAGNSDAATILIKIQQHLQSHHSYSLSYDPAGDEPLNDFILNNRSAHCQYFASAVVMMARAVGIPARFVTGYYAHEPYGDQKLVVRERDAHAWAECWIDGQGWITVDATPSGGRPDGLFPQTSNWRHWWEWFTDIPSQIKQWCMSLSRQTLILLIAVPAGVILAVKLLRLVRNRRRRKHPNDTGYLQPAKDLAEAGRRFELCLRRDGIPCTPQRTWREHLQAITLIDAAAYLQFVEAYDRARFGADQDALPLLNQSIERLEQSPTQPGSSHHGPTH